MKYWRCEWMLFGHVLFMIGSSHHLPCAVGLRPSTCGLGPPAGPTGLGTEVGVTDIQLFLPHHLKRLVWSSSFPWPSTVPWPFTVPWTPTIPWPLPTCAARGLEDLRDVIWLVARQPDETSLTLKASFPQHSASPPGFSWGVHLGKVGRAASSHLAEGQGSINIR